ncbi:RNase H family protein [Granulicoccus sp. GXG6511]|uniref:RNase H family protein n=1 Tax=Granulicoccus sp. GXG6511 TaxID=3381351 RepID=UPI003D7D91AE
MTIIAAADGSALGNPGPAGWAWYVDDTCWAAGGWPHGTNNMGELMAVLDLLRQTAGSDQDLHVLCDSQYAINVISKWTAGWKRKNWRKADGKPVMNVELVKALDEAMQGRRVTFEWVRGHAGHELNEAADRLARAVATAYQQGQDPITGPGFEGAAASPADDFRVGQTEPVAALFSLDPEDPELDDDLEDLALPGDEPIEDPDPDDLFGPVDVPGLDADVTAIEHVIDLERALLTATVRSDPSRVAALLHPDWYEIGTSGRIWNRAEMLAAIGPLPGEAECEVVDAQRLGPDQILLVWRSTGVGPAALRTSLWVRREANWEQRFHQGTPEA